MKNSQKTKNEIVLAAWNLLEEVGLENFSVRKLADKVGKTVSTLYHYFPNKEMVLGELIEMAISDIQFPINTQNWKDKLIEYGKNILIVLNRYPSLAQLLLEIPPQLPNYERLNDQLLMIANDIPIEKKEKLFFVSIYLNFILTFKIDADRLGKKNSTMPHEDFLYSSSNPFLKSYQDEGFYDYLGTEEMFEFGLNLLINGIVNKE